jgi:thioredoxin reductase (NADPH)
MESIGGDLRQMQRIPLTASHVAALRAAGEVKYQQGTFPARPGQLADLCLRGRWRDRTRQRFTNDITGRRQAKLGYGRDIFLEWWQFFNAERARFRDTNVIETPRDAIDADVADSGNVGHGHHSLFRAPWLVVHSALVCPDWQRVDRDVRQIAEFANRSRIPFSGRAWQRRGGATA